MAKYQDFKLHSELVEHLTLNNRKLLRSNENLKASVEKHLNENKALEEKLLCAEDKHKKEVEILEEKFKEADSKTFILSTKLQSLSDEAEELKNDNKNLSYKVEELSEEKRKNQVEIGKLKEQLSGNGTQMYLPKSVGCRNPHLLQNRYDSLKRANDSLRKQVSALAIELRKTKEYAKYITDIVHKQEIRLRQWNIDDENAESRRRKHTITDLTERVAKSDDKVKKQSVLLYKMKVKMDKLTSENEILQGKLDAVLATQPKKQKLDKLVNRLRNTREESENPDEDLDIEDEPLCLIKSKCSNSNTKNGSNNSSSNKGKDINKIGEDKSKGISILNGNAKVSDNQQGVRDFNDQDDERPLNLKRARRDCTLAHVLPLKKRNGIS